MKESEIKIVTLPPLHVVCFHGFGKNPEEQAWSKTEAWARSKGLWEDGQPRRFFGFNNPSPDPGSPNYGYDVWMTVGPGTRADGDAALLDFPGGQYAVMHCPVRNPAEDIPASWQRLVVWLENSEYRSGTHQWLEEHIFLPNRDNFALDLYMPVKV